MLTHKQEYLEMIFIMNAVHYEPKFFIKSLLSHGLTETSPNYQKLNLKTISIIYLEIFLANVMLNLEILILKLSKDAD